MRILGVFILLVSHAAAQFKSNVPLVVAPVTVRDSHGEFVDGLSPDDLTLYDNNVPQRIQTDWMMFPISLVVAVQTSANAGAVIDKLGGTGILFSQALAADAGQTAVITFSDAVKVHQDFTSAPDQVTRSLRMLRKEGDSAHTLDALDEAVTMLEKQPSGRRRIVLMIAEKRDRGSETRIAEAMARVQRSNVVVYWLTWSPFLQPFTVKPKTAEDLKPEAERDKRRPDETGVPFDNGPGNPMYAIGELARLRQPDLSRVFTETTGGRALSVLKKSGLEDAIELVSREVHRQYILSFVPSRTEPPTFHSIRVVVKNRPDLRITTRAGYWPIP